jgi:hypothetical protein
MEENFKRDVIREVRAGNGRVLLHDEVEERPNVFAIVPLWENVSEEDIMTPEDVFNLMAREGYKVSYSGLIRVHWFLMYRFVDRLWPRCYRMSAVHF